MMPLRMRFFASCIGSARKTSFCGKNVWSILMCYPCLLMIRLSYLPMAGLFLLCLLSRLLFEPGDNGFGLLTFFGREIHWA